MGGCAFGGLFIPGLEKTSYVQHVRRSCLAAREEAPGLCGAGPAGAGSCPPRGTGHGTPWPPTASWEGARSSWGRRSSTVDGYRGAWKTTSAREPGPRERTPAWESQAGAEGGGGKTSTESPRSLERSVRKGQYQGGNQRPDPDIMDLHHPGTQPSNILPSRGMETESISKPGLFFTGDLFVFLGDQLEFGDELGSCSPRSHPRAAPCNVWAGDGVGKQSETSFQEFIYLLEGKGLLDVGFAMPG